MRDICVSLVCAEVCKAKGVYGRDAEAAGAVYVYVAGGGTAGCPSGKKSMRRLTVAIRSIKEARNERQRRWTAHGSTTPRRKESGGGCRYWCRCLMRVHTVHTG